MSLLLLSLSGKSPVLDFCQEFAPSLISLRTIQGAPAPVPGMVDVQGNLAPTLI